MDRTAADSQVFLAPVWQPADFLPGIFGCALPVVAGGPNAMSVFFGNATTPALTRDATAWVVR